MEAIYELKTVFMRDILKRNESQCKTDQRNAVTAPSYDSTNLVKKCLKHDVVQTKIMSLRIAKPLQKVQKLFQISMRASKGEQLPITRSKLHNPTWKALSSRHDDDYFSTDSPPQVTSLNSSLVLDSSSSLSAAIGYLPESFVTSPVLFPVRSLVRAPKQTQHHHSTNPARSPALLASPTSLHSDLSIDGNAHMEKYWGRLLNINELAIIEMVSGLLSPNTRDTYEVTEQKKGSFHVVYVLRSSQGHKFCLKIPAQGQEGRWSCDDAILLRSEALTMRLIQQKTKVPVPTMLAYDATLGNEVGAPFILMSYIEGEPLSTLWNQWIEDGTQAEKEPLIYAALTHAMADLSLLTFNKIGMLSFPDDNGMPIITDRLESRSYYDDDDAGSYRRVWKSYGPFETSKEYYMDRFNANKCLDWDGLPCGVELAGVRKFLDVCMASIPASLDNEDDSKEVFGLAHDDLDLENTLFDEDCNLVGIIDWDKVHMAPIYLSYGAVPLWLHEDWNPSYNWPYGDVISSPWTLAKSRQLYGSALRKHLSKPDDWLVPEKSVILAVLEQAFKEIDLAEMRCSRFMTRIIPMIMPTVDPADFFHALSMNEEEEEDGGWAKIVDFDSKQCLIEQVTKLFRCLPKQPDGPKAQHIKEDDTSSYVDDEAVNGKIEASSDETRVDA